MKMVKLLGMEVLSVGLQPGLVSALIDMNVDSSDLITFLNINDGLDYLKNRFICDNEIEEPDEYPELEEEKAVTDE